MQCKWLVKHKKCGCRAVVVQACELNGPFGYIRVISADAPYAFGGGQGTVRIVLRILGNNRGVCWGL